MRCAIVAKQPFLVEYLVKFHDEILEDQSFFKHIVKDIDGKQMELFMKHEKFKPSKELFYSACHYGNLDVVKELLKDKRINPAEDNNDGLYASAINGHKDIVSLLLQDKRVRNTPIHDHPWELCNYRGHKEYAAFLKGYDFNTNKRKLGGLFLE